MVAPARSREPDGLRLDARDHAILRILAREGRISKRELAERVNLSPTPTWERMRRMEEAGIIRGYRAEIVLGATAPGMTVMVTAELAHHRAADFRAFEAAISERQEIRGAWALAGGLDYLLEVQVSDIRRFQTLMDELLDANIGLARYFSYVVTKPVKLPALQEPFFPDAPEAA